MKNAFDCTTVDMRGHEYELWEKQSPKQWSMLRGDPLLHLMVIKFYFVDWIIPDIIWFI